MGEIKTLFCNFNTKPSQNKWQLKNILLLFKFYTASKNINLKKLLILLYLFWKKGIQKPTKKDQKYLEKTLKTWKKIIEKSWNFVCQPHWEPWLRCLEKETRHNITETECWTSNIRMQLHTWHNARGILVSNSKRVRMRRWPHKLGVAKVPGKVHSVCRGNVPGCQADLHVHSKMQPRQNKAASLPQRPSSLTQTTESVISHSLHFGRTHPRPWLSLSRNKFLSLHIFSFQSAVLARHSRASANLWVLKCFAVYL